MYNENELLRAILTEAQNEYVLNDHTALGRVLDILWRLVGLQESQSVPVVGPAPVGLPPEPQPVDAAGNLIPTPPEFKLAPAAPTPLAPVAEPPVPLPTPPPSAPISIADSAPVFTTNAELTPSVEAPPVENVSG